MEGTVSCDTTRESGICPWVDFSFVLSISTPDTNEGICTGWEGRPPTCLVRPHLYRVGASTGTNAGTFVPGRISTRYKCAILTFVLGGDMSRYKYADICTGALSSLIQM
jgi:hypothetical protein